MCFSLTALPSCWMPLAASIRWCLHAERSSFGAGSGNPCADSTTEIQTQLLLRLAQPKGATDKRARHRRHRLDERPPRAGCRAAEKAAHLEPDGHRQLRPGQKRKVRQEQLCTRSESTPQVGQEAAGWQVIIVSVMADSVASTACNWHCAVSGSKTSASIMMGLSRHPMTEKRKNYLL